MKRQFLAAILAFIFFSNCDKKNDCSCDGDVKSYLPRTAGDLSYNQYKSKWMLSYSPGRGAFANFFPCNTSQDSLQAILQGANQTQTFLVWFSGNTKSPCSNEDFGTIPPLTTFEYIDLEAISRN